MLKYKPLAETDIGAEIIDLDLKSATNFELRQLGRILADHLIVVIRNQKLTVEDDVRVCQAIGEIEVVPPDVYFRCPVNEKGSVVPEVMRVTGMKDETNKPIGLFGHNTELDWHANRASNEKERKPIVYLRSVFGSQGSKTSWADCSAAYYNLPEYLKQRLDGLKGIYGFEPGRYTTSSEFKSHRNESGINFIQTNPFNKKKGMYFPFLQLFGFVGVPDDEFKELYDQLKEHVLRPDYIYNHNWEDGDVILSDQWHTIHKRWPCDVSLRLLHRITMDYSKIGFQ